MNNILTVLSSALMHISFILGLLMIFIHEIDRSKK